MEYEDAIHSGPIDDQVIERWGYDETFELMEQDEDLLLMRTEFFPALFRLAEDPECPKNDYAISIMDYTLILHPLFDQVRYLPDLEFAIGLGQYANRKEVKDWIANLKTRLVFLTLNEAVDEKMAIKMGRYLLNGISRKADISIYGRTIDSWIIELSVPPFHIHKEWLTINNSSGKVLRHYGLNLPKALSIFKLPI